jgi:glycosyltransferase involved in cell wall biosynthesis
MPQDGAGSMGGDLTLKPVHRPRLSVVIPVYNEAAGIAGALAQALDALDALVDDWELVVVDNASTDATAALVAPLLDDPRARLLVNDANRGKGHSVRRGMLAATGDLILHCDADCVPSLRSLPRMLELIEEADVVVGSRLAPGAAVGRRQPLRRRIVGSAFVGLCRRVLAEPTRDLYCGFKLWRAPAAREVFARTLLDGWVFDAETLAMARALGYPPAEVGIAWTDRKGSRLSMPRVVVPALRDLLRARAHVRREAARGPAERVLEPMR